MRRAWETSLDNLKDFFNNLQSFVAASILEPEDRGEMLISLEHCILIASSLVGVRNYHAAFAGQGRVFFFFFFFSCIIFFFLVVYAGLSMASITRLKVIWEKVPAKTAAMMDELHALFDPSKNHLNYQRALDATPFDAPVIPNMVLILKWLFTIEEINPTLTATGNINLEKMRMLYLIASKIETLQQHPPFVSVVSAEVLSFCRSFATSPSSCFKSEAALFDLSLARVPRAAEGLFGLV